MTSKILEPILKNQIVVALGVILLAWIVYKIRFTIGILAFSYIFVVALIPTIRYIQSKGASLSISISIVYFGIFGFLAAIILILSPNIITQVKNLAIEAPIHLQRISNLVKNGNPIITYIGDLTQSAISNFSDAILQYANQAFRYVIAFVAVIALSIYGISYHDKIINSLFGRMSKNSKNNFLAQINEIEETLSRWAQGQIIISIIVGVITWIALAIAGIESALALGFIAGILEFIPYIGPILSSIPAIAIALGHSAGLALTVALIFIGIQMAENYLIVPLVIRGRTDLNPGLTILAVFTGGELFGVVGAILSVPITIVTKIILKNNFSASHQT